MEKSDDKLTPVVVYDPYARKNVNIAPVLWAINEYFQGFEHAADELTKMIEDFAANTSDEMIDNMGENAFSNHFYNLAILRRTFAAMGTGRKPDF